MKIKYNVNRGICSDICDIFKHIYVGTSKCLKCQFYFGGDFERKYVDCNHPSKIKMKKNIEFILEKKLDDEQIIELQKILRGV